MSSVLELRQKRRPIETGGGQKETASEGVVSGEEVVELLAKDVKQGRRRREGENQEYTSGSTRHHFIWSY